MKDKFSPYKPDIYTLEEMQKRSEDFYKWMNKRRSIRDFSLQPIPQSVIENIILTASTAPSGANKQPWTFCLVSSKDLQREIRFAAEAEEYENYNNRMSPDWIEDLGPFGTNWEKQFLEEVPWIIVVFKRIYEDINGVKRNNYYVNESVGIAVGFLLAAIHNVGLVALTHTPSPMNFLAKILKRPDNERAFLVIPVGYPAENASVPKIKRKELKDVAVFY